MGRPDTSNACESDTPEALEGHRVFGPVLPRRHVGGSCPCVHHRILRGLAGGHVAVLCDVQLHVCRE